MPRAYKSLNPALLKGEWVPTEDGKAPRLKKMLDFLEKLCFRCFIGKYLICHSIVFKPKENVPFIIFEFRRSFTFS
jgi:hypothetical protein